MKRAGIYVIRRAGTSQCYVGSSSNLTRRWSTHRRLLNMGEHHAAHLQNAWTKHGAQPFSFEVLELVPGDGDALRLALLCREQHWIDALHPCFNSAPAAGSTLGFKMPRDIVERHRQKLLGRQAAPEEAERLRNLARGRKRRPETVEKLRQAGHRRGMPQSAIENSAAARRGRKLSPEHVEKMRALSTGRKHRPEVLAARSAALSAETRKRMGAGSRGKPRSPEHAAKIAEALRAYHQRRRDGLPA